MPRIRNWTPCSARPGRKNVIAFDLIESQFRHLEKAMKFNSLLTNAVIFHNALDIAEIVRRLLEEGGEIDPEDLAHITRT
ncbi:Tn3 family transposase [Streptomyces sp. NPDC001851]|uniref:Tn3 family transposase n=1 Tax=Streptomyces sp. NPDC001851 TaxID=3154529 RepID=UPI0033348095